MPSEPVRRRHERAQALLLAVTACAHVVASAHRERDEPLRLGGDRVDDVHGLQLDLAREVYEAADAMLEADICHFSGPGDELAPRRRLRLAVADLVAGLAGLPAAWRPAAVPRVEDALASPHHRRVLARLVRWKLLGLARAADAGEPPGPVLAEAAAAGLRESLGRLDRAERDLRLAPVAISLSARHRQEAIAAFDRTWRRVTSKLRRLYRAVGIDELLAVPQSPTPRRPQVRRPLRRPQPPRSPRRPRNPDRRTRGDRGA
jgi:hypothetical protein